MAAEKNYQLPFHTLCRQFGIETLCTCCLADEESAIVPASMDPVVPVVNAMGSATWPTRIFRLVVYNSKDDHW